MDPADVNALFVTLANNRSLGSGGEHWIPFCLPGLDRMALAQVYVKRLETSVITGTSESETSSSLTTRLISDDTRSVLLPQSDGAVPNLFLVFVSTDVGNFHAISAHAKRVEENLISTGASNLIFRACRTPLALPGGVLDVKVTLQGGQAFVASFAPEMATSIAQGYAEIQTTLQTAGDDNQQLFRTCRLDTADLVTVHQMIWRTSEFEMHLTLAGHVTSPGKALEVYAYIKDHELKFFIPVRIPLKSWMTGRSDTDGEKSLMKRITSLLI